MIGQIEAFLQWWIFEANISSFKMTHGELSASIKQCIIIRYFMKVDVKFAEILWKLTAPFREQILEKTQLLKGVYGL